ncbi:ATP-binding protein [Streptomyces sp. NBC_01549]|uniref:AAA family ATPase n=1 Tax=Streptomyces sp. NBC_01549 TaxID=2975874 RepID=UPI00225694B9|nr:AAA family ATPase [Streptomyces sp. NBC_01549]MCX4598464.1 ATP-binding protein [Streptomyces sp. NBC_01549]
MFIDVVQVSKEPPAPGSAGLVLVPVNTHDQGYRTTYRLYIRAEDHGRALLLGTVKVGSTEQQPGGRALRAGRYSSLNANGRSLWFSLGQDDEYYVNIAALGNEIRISILTALGDIAYDPGTFAVAMEHAVTHVSLLRTVTSVTVEQQFRRIARGGARLGRGYDYQYVGPRSADGHSRTTLDFVVDPLSIPPSNIHVLIGRNGVGKTTLLREIARAAVRVDQADDGSGFWPRGAAPSMPMLANVVSISFSAFDPFANLVDQRPDGLVSFEYVGLHIRAGAHDERKSHTDLAAEFSGSLAAIHSSGRTQRWARAVSGLMTDPAFAASSVPGLVDDMAGTGPDTFTHEGPQRVFAELSSGHACVILILTRLVELVAEQTLVLLDEPESHLHPPLLSAFIRTLSQLLAARNGVAIIATHSPVVLQEVPRSSVWKLIRHGRLRAERPSIETFGENVGVLTHEVFGLEVRQSGFLATLQAAVDQLDTYEQVLQHFGGQLGSEAKGIVRILLADKSAGEDS